MVEPGPEGRVLVVAGGSGGVGASVLAAAVAVRGARAGRRVVLVDGCPLGGGLDVTLGAEQRRGLRWPELAGLTGQADGPAILARLPVSDGVPVLSHDRVGPPGPPGPVIRAVVEALADTVDLVVVDLDLGRETSDGLLDLADRCLLVGGTAMRQVAALSVAVRLLRERLPGPERLGCCLRDDSGADGLADLVETELGVPVLVRLRHDKGVGPDLEHGIAPGSRGRGRLVEAVDVVLAWAVDPGGGPVGVGADQRAGTASRTAA